MIRSFWWIAAAAGFCAAALAVETKTWTQSEFSEFDKGTLKGLALSSNGRLSLAPEFRELFDAGTRQLWSLAADSKGRVYAGGAEGKIFVVEADGKGRLLASIEGATVYALAVNARDELFAATAPEAAVYRVTPDGKASEFARLKARYVWALAPGPGGVLYVATGDPGQIWSVNSGGQAALLFDSEEMHVRSLAVDPKGTLYAGTEPGGLIFRVSPKGEGFVVHQTGKREVTALAVSPGGEIWAAAVGNRSAAPAPVTPAPAPAAQPPTPAPAAGAAPQGQTSATPPRPTAPAPVPLLPAAAGGSEIWRIAPDGEPRLMWSHAQHIVYSLAFDSKGLPVAGTGNEGLVFRIDSQQIHTRLADADPGQITAMAGVRGALYAATSNPARIVRLGPGLEKQGTIESEPFDARAFTYWGRLRWEGAERGGGIRLEVRSGNLDQAQKHWSPWTPVQPGAGSRIAAPPARFLAWRATLTAAPDGTSPELSLVEVAYQPKNVAPVIERIEVTPANYKFPAPSSSLTASSSLSLPPIGQVRRSAPSSPVTDGSGSATLTYEKGWIGARWRATDANGDNPQYKLEIRGVEEREWKPLKDKIAQSHYSFDTSGFADGMYVLRLTATDQPDNYPGEGLESRMESEPFLIDNTPPEISGLAAAIEGSRIRIRFRAADKWSALQSAEYSINGGEWIAVPPTTRITDSPAHDYEAVAEKPAGSEFTIAVKVFDERDNAAAQKVVLRQ
jgi:hypothetical protein